MTRDLALPKQFSLQEIILHELSKTCWGDIVLIVDCKPIFVPQETEILVAHRATVINNLSEVSKSCPKIFSTELPKLLKDKLVNAVICLQQGYGEALIWEEKFKSDLPFTALNPLKAGPYSAKNFIDPTGHFDDLAWAERFVADENQSVRFRFKLACCYCFEETIMHLWNAIKTNEKLPLKDILTRIESKYIGLASIWAYQLENKFDQLMERDRDLANGFNAGGLSYAIFRGHEYAARFFWEGCCDTEKAKFLQEPEFDNLSVAAATNCYGLVNFIYSLLPFEQKINLIAWTLEHNVRDAWIWSCLLHSPFYESVLKDILILPIPSEIYKRLLRSLSFEIKVLKNPIHQRIFITLWDHLSQEQRNQILEMDDFYLIVVNLAQIKNIDVLKTIIQPLSHDNKERMLLRYSYSAGMLALDEFSRAGDYDSLLHFLLSFLIDQNPITQKLSLRSDASDFFDRFMKDEFFIVWSKNHIPESERKEVNKVIESLEGSLQVLYQLLEQVEHAVPSIHFISFWNR